MLYSPNQASPIQFLRSKYALSNSAQLPIAQHEYPATATPALLVAGSEHSQPQSLLLRIPSESLTHVTASLEPPSLLALSSVNHVLYGHVNDDNTWYRAFAYQLLGISPESDLSQTTGLMLRRSQPSWKREFIARFNLQKRWEHSMNSTTTHIPHHSTVNSMHVMLSDFLLTSSLQYGVVSRSNPFTGKVLRGFLDASGTGLGIGNPNAEFTPNVSACAMTSNGGTAKIFWGLITGDVHIVTAAKATDPRASSLMIRCNIADEHHGAVLDAIWDENKLDRAVSGGIDGRVKVWDTNLAECLWTSSPRPGDWSVKIASALTQGVVAAAMLSGDIVFWTHLDTAAEPVELRVPCPKKTKVDAEPPQVRSLYLDYSTSGMISALVEYAHDSVFYRVTLDTASGSVTTTQFGDPSSPAISCVSPYFARPSHLHDRNFVITGDKLGCVCIFDWTSATSPVQPTYKFEAFKDGSTVTALTWNDVILLIGSANGSVKVFDALTFVHLRSFSTHHAKSSSTRHTYGGRDRTKDAVSQIIIAGQKDLMLVSAGERVLAFRAGPVSMNSIAGGKGKGGGVRGRNTASDISISRKKSRGAMGKFYKQLELDQSITESRKIIQLEDETRKRTFGREKEQRKGLEKLGLGNEQEAVEYLLMVSRDEEEQRLRQQAQEEGIFEGDFEDELAVPAAFSSAITLTPPVVLSEPTRPSLISTPMSSPPTSARLISAPSIPIKDEVNFPSISPVPTPSTSVGSSDSFSASSSRNAAGGAWASTRTKTAPETSSTNRASSGSYGTTAPGLSSSLASSSSLTSSMSRISSSASNGSSFARSSSVREEDEMREELRYALQLSLVEQ